LKKARKGASVFPKSGASILTNSRAMLGCDSYIVSHLAIVDANKALLDDYYLHYFLRTVDFGEIAQSEEGYPSLRLSEISELDIPIPPIDEQRRIVARIEELTRRAEEARKLRHEAVAAIGVAFSSAIDNFFKDRNKDWAEATVKQLCGKPQYGYTESANSEDIGPRFLRITDIQDGQVNWNMVPYCECRETGKYQLFDGDIVFARTGATTGKSYLVRNPPVAVFASYLIRIRPGELVIPEYIWWYFQSSSYRASVFNGIDVGNRPNMNGTKLGNLKIPFPKSKKTQQKIVDQIEGISAKLNELRQLQTETDTELEAFQSALLAKAFRGEL
jgi:type I restriction enzyme S subunit